LLDADSKICESLRHVRTCGDARGPFKGKCQANPDCCQAKPYTIPVMTVSSLNISIKKLTFMSC